MREIIGIDIGGSKIRGVVWDGRRVRRALVIQTPRTAAAVRRALATIALVLNRGRRIDRIGVGSAGVIKGGAIAWSPNISCLKRFKVAAALRGYRVRLDNDARAFARVEYAKGAARGAKRALFFTFGTGVGRAYGEGGEVRKVKRFEYPERWEREYQKIRGSAAVARYLAAHVAPIMERYRPAVVVLGGKVGEWGAFRTRFRRALRARGFRGRIVKSRHGAFAGAIGAALLFKD